VSIWRLLVRLGVEEKSELAVAASRPGAAPAKGTSDAAQIGV